MNYGDKTRSVTIRLTPEQYAFLDKSASALEVTPSRFLRMVVNATMQGSQVLEQAVKQSEHAETDKHNQLEH